MVPKSGDGKTKETETMETLTDVVSSTSNTDDSGESEVDEDLEDSDFEWDKDSFDGVEYYSSDHSACLDKEFCRKCRNHDRAVVETKGFFEEPDDFPAFLWAGIAPVPDLNGEYKEGITNREFIGNMVSECVDKYNKRNNKNLIYERVLRANYNPGGNTPYYATIAVRESDSPDAPLVEYQAKVVWFAGASYPVFCRPSPSPKKVTLMDMAPKSNNGETKDGYSSLETSTDVASSSLEKPKVETPNLEDYGVDEEEDSASEWDKDSFDGQEYQSSDHNEEYSDEEFHQKCVCYRRAVIETKGFFEESDDFPAFLWSGIAPVPDLDEEFDESMTTREFIGNMATVCVEEYNKRNMKNLKYERVLRANFNPGGRTTYYITIAARECDDAPLVEYQAKVIWCAGETYPILCRPSPSPK